MAIQINRLFRHQEASINAIRMYPNIPLVFLIGGFGCATGDTLLSTPSGPIPLYKFEGGLVNTPEGPRNASWPIPSQSETVLVKGDDFQIRCNGAHLLMESTGKWISVSEVLVRLLASLIYSIPQATNEAYDPRALLSDVQHWMQRVLDYLYCYLSCFHYDDRQLHSLEAADQDDSPLREYAQVHNPDVYGDGQILSLCIRLVRFFYSLQRLHSTNPEDRLSSVYAALTTGSYQKLRADLAQALSLSPCLIDLPLSTFVVGESTFLIPAYDTSCFDTYIITQDHRQSHIGDVIFTGFDWVYRFHVEESECYYANNVLNHNCGKSFTDVQLLLFLLSAYLDIGEPINIGLFGVTIKLLRQTVVADFERALDAAGIAYRDNSQAGTITIRNITIIYLAMQDPDDIYAFNFHCALCDEIDEVPPERVKKIVTAIQERCRKVMPRGRNMPSRDPFIFFSTTAQGLGGTYQLIRYMEKAGIPYIKIRGRTQDNTTLAHTQLEMLRALYTEDEARAYLDGEFMNLSTGRVYPEFDRSRHTSIPIEVNEDDIIYCGQDFNAGYNMSAHIISRQVGPNPTMFLIREEHYDYVGDSFRLLRQTYPKNRIIMIPDASGKEIMSGFTEEAEKFNIEVFWNNKNPSISERITSVNKALRFNQLFVANTCERALMALETRDFDDVGKPRKGKGPEALDHVCDSLEYAVWRIIHTLNGYDKILETIRAIHHNSYDNVLEVVKNGA